MVNFKTLVLSTSLCGAFFGSAGVAAAQSPAQTPRIEAPAVPYQSPYAFGSLAATADFSAGLFSPSSVGVDLEYSLHPFLAVATQARMSSNESLAPGFLVRGRYGWRGVAGGVGLGAHHHDKQFDRDFWSIGNDVEFYNVLSFDTDVFGEYRFDSGFMLRSTVRYSNVLSTGSCSGVNCYEGKQASDRLNVTASVGMHF
jgi:hypothetical protein